MCSYHLQLWRKQLTVLAFCIYCYSCQIVRAQETDSNNIISASPLLTFAEQFEELREQCKDKPFDENCDQRKADLRKKLFQTKALCKENPQDPSCGALRETREKTENDIDTFCLKNPNDRRCQRKREMQKKHALKSAEFCAKNPLSTKCTNTGKKPSRYELLVENCRAYPDQKRCKSISKQYGFIKPPKTDGMAADSF